MYSASRYFAPRYFAPRLFAGVAPTLLTPEPVALGGDTIAYLLTVAGGSNMGAAVGFKVRRNGTLVYDGPSPKFLDEELTNGVAYTYTVSAYDAAGNESAESEPVTVTPGVPGGGGTRIVQPVERRVVVTSPCQ